MQNENSFTSGRFLLTLKINPLTIKGFHFCRIADEVRLRISEFTSYSA